MTAHPDKVGGDEEMYLDKGVGEKALADIGESQDQSNEIIEGFSAEVNRSEHNMLMQADSTKPVHSKLPP